MIPRSSLAALERDAVALDVAGEPFRELRGVEAVLRQVVAVASEATLGMRLDVRGHRAEGLSVELVAERLVDALHGAERVERQVGVLNVDESGRRGARRGRCRGRRSSPRACRVQCRAM